MAAEETWAREFVSGDSPQTREEQISKLFEALRDSVYRYVLTITREASGAEEITQEVFLRLVRELGAGRGIKNHQAWVFRVAHNLAMDETRTRKFRRDVDDVEWREMQDTRVDPHPTPEAAAQASQEASHWQIALTSLPELQRSCLLLRAEGFRYREIADILGVSTSTVAESMRRAIRRMMKGPHA